MANKRVWTVLALLVLIACVAVAVMSPPRCDSRRLAIGETLLVAGCTRR